MTKERYKLLLAEDDINLGILLSKYLHREGFDVELCQDGIQALKVFRQHSFNLCLVDVMMPKMDGFSFVKSLRRIDKNIPFIFITAKSFKEDKLIGYGLGAEDYVTKPFDQEELLWKIKAIIRRVTENSIEKKSELTLIGKYTFDASTHSLTIGGISKRMTAKESNVLFYLFQHQNTIIRREDMLKDLWGENDYFFGRSLDVFITKIRKYLKEDEDLSIENIFGVGFIFNVPEIRENAEK